MDALSFDVYHADYEEKVMEAKSEIRHDLSNAEEAEEPSGGGGTSDEAPSDRARDEQANNPLDMDSIKDHAYYVSSELAAGETVPVGGTEKAQNVSTKSSTSSSSSSDHSYNFGTMSLYQQEFLAPRMSYDRDSQHQKLVAVIGREFDRPHDMAVNLQKLVSWQPECTGKDIPEAKFVPFTLKRKALLKGSFDSQELRRHDLICMCYNASEARILLTGTDGFYSSLLRHVESLLGPNKVAFLISNYTPPSGTLEPVTADGGLLPPSLKSRLYNQPALRLYLDEGQVLSWSDAPSGLQVGRLLELTRLDLNPRSMLSTAVDQCCVL